MIQKTKIELSEEPWLYVATPQQTHCGNLQCNELSFTVFLCKRGGLTRGVPLYQNEH